MASYNLCQILGSNFNKNEDVRFIVMTGGSNEWHLDDSYLVGMNSSTNPDGISTEYNQIWEAKGSDAAKNPGKLVLLDADGVTGDGNAAKKSEDELMSNPQTLKAFIDYCVNNYPAEKYDLILWDHGGGPMNSFGVDQHYEYASINLEGLIDAFSDNSLARSGKKFDFINFDACLMGNIECALALADYADYYIASPETIPGYGQEYSGWLNLVGATPDIDTYKLGCKIVDDFISFYTNGEGSDQEATLAITDNKKLLASGLVHKLNQLARTLDTQASQTTNMEYAFYDEMRSARTSIQYGNMCYFDLGNFVQSLGVAIDEAKLDTAHDSVDTTSAYTNLASDIARILNNKDIFYARGTSGISAGPELYRKTDGSTTYGSLSPGAFSITFPVPKDYASMDDYLAQLEDALDNIPADGRRSFLQNYRSAIARYTLVQFTGAVVTEAINSGIERANINYDTLRTFGNYGIVINAKDGSTLWDSYTKKLIDVLGGGNAVRSWLDRVIRQQAAEAVSNKDVSSKDVKHPSGTGREITIVNTHKRVISSVNENISLELPSVKKYLEEHPEDAAQYKKLRQDEQKIVIGSHEGILSVSDTNRSSIINDFAKGYIEWRNDPTSIWTFPPSEDMWYAIKDASGNLHVACVESGRSPDELIATVTATSAEGAQQMWVLAFKYADSSCEGVGSLSEILAFGNDMNFRPIMAKDLQGSFSAMSVQRVSFDFAGIFQWQADLPLSATEFMINASNASSIELVYVPISSISDIADTTGDGDPLSRSYIVKDIYGAEIDITEAVNNPVGTLTSIEFAQIEPTVFNGREQSPRVVLNGKVLQEGVDYRITRGLKADVYKNAATYDVMLVGIGDYAYGHIAEFTIKPAPIADASINGLTNAVYTGKPIEQNMTLSFAGIVLVEGVDYTVTYANNIEAGTATITIRGIGNFMGSVTRTFKISAEQRQDTTPSSDTEPPSVKPHMASSSTKRNLASMGDELPATAFAILALLALTGVGIAVNANKNE